MRKHLLTAFGAAACLAAAPASATIFDFSIYQGFQSITGSFNCTANGDGSCTIDAILPGGTASYDASHGPYAITGLSNWSKNFAVTDFQLLPGGKLTRGGFSFYVDDGTMFGRNFNVSENDHYVFFDGSIGSVFELTDDVNNPFGNAGNTAVFSLSERAAVPETATWAMMVMGFGLAGAAMRRRRTSRSVSFARA